ALLEGLMLLQNAIGTQRRPLSWMVGPQGIERVTPPSMRDAKRDARRAARDLRSPDAL
ncbi:MAG: NADH-quinone oxidoreductase subunit B, partial [Gluconacetobacter sp.]